MDYMIFLHREFSIPTLKDLITTQTQAFYAKLPLVASATYYQIGQFDLDLDLD